MLSVHIRKPASLLQRYVQCYVQRELCTRNPQVVQSVPARAVPVLEFVCGDPVRIRHSGSSTVETSPKAALVGMFTRPYGELYLQGTFESFVIIFQPAGLSELFRVDLSELTDHVYDAQAVAGRAIAELEQRLGDCDSFASRVSTADAFLGRRIPDHSGIDHLWSTAGLIFARNGRVRIPDLAACSGVGTRQFERVFGSRFGMRPKQYSRIVRFQAALDSKARSSKAWADVAHDFGYHDQMHMIHDFEEFSGKTPTETLRLVEICYRQQIEAVRIGMRVDDLRLIPRFVV